MSDSTQTKLTTSRICQLQQNYTDDINDKGLLVKTLVFSVFEMKMIVEWNYINYTIIVLFTLIADVVLADPPEDPPPLPLHHEHPCDGGDG